ncbi:MAG: peptidase C45 acyl-coenzyme A:6-aminopenicillanic acid acyl-transferase [uncultured bacterium]|nr:MAG: peptidase C45 acyl-coenzyme A:6-aminopenicillanic acid acyl-transferase [uncultured bacterium]
MSNIFTLKGHLAKRALSQGQIFKNHFPTLLNEIRRIPLSSLPITAPRFVYYLGLPVIGSIYLKKHRALLESHFKENYYEGLLALADGFKLKPAMLYGFAGFEPLSSKLPYTLGCCSITFSKESTQAGKPLLAYNHDFPDPFADFLFLKKNLPAKGYANLSMGYPPLLGAIAGVNECGLAMSLNHAYATDTYLNEGLPPTLIVQAALNECGSVKEAIDVISQTPTTNGSMITLLDASGDRAVIEVSATKKQIRRPKNEIDVTLNKYQAPFMEEVEVPLQAMGKGIYQGHLIHEHNIKRRARIDTLVNNQTQPLPTSLIHQWLSDHEGGAGNLSTLCRHDNKTASTLTSLIASPQDLSLDVIWGVACKGEYKKYSLIN